MILPDQLDGLQRSQIPVPDRAPGWWSLGEHYSCIPHEVHPWPSDVVKRIKAFDKGFFPGQVKAVYRRPVDEAGHYEDVVFHRHCVLRYEPFPRKYPNLKDHHVEMPTGYRGPKPNIVECWLEGDPVGGDPDLPGEYQPITGDIPYAMEEAFRATENHRDDVELAWVRRVVDRQKERKRKAQETLDYIKRDIERFAQPRLDKVSEVELREYLASREEDRRRWYQSIRA